MSILQHSPRSLLELSPQNLKRLYSIFDAIEHTLGNLKVAREICRSGRSLLSTRVNCIEHEISATEFQDLLRRIAKSEGEALARRDEGAADLARYIQEGTSTID